jgi:hypothetical protein
VTAELPHRPHRTRRFTRRLLGRSRVLFLLVLLAVGTLEVLDESRLSDRSEIIHVVVRTPGAPDGAINLMRNPDRSVGSVRDFPTGSVAHVLPGSSPGFFVVHAAGGTFRAFSDRSPHRGEPVEYLDALPGLASQAAVPQPVFYDPEASSIFTLDGAPWQGPATRPRNYGAVGWTASHRLP